MTTLILIYIFLSIASAESCYPIEVTTISGEPVLGAHVFILDTDVGTTDSGGMVYPENDLVDKILGPINFYGLTRYAYVSACYCGSCKGDGRIGTKLNYFGFCSDKPPLYLQISNECGGSYGDLGLRPNCNCPEEIEELNVLDENLDLDLTVRDGDTTDGQTLPGVRVSGFDGTGKSFDQITDSKGLTVLKGSPGAWHFEASKDGYETRNWDWEIATSGSMRYFLFKSQTPKIENIGFYIIFHEDSLNGPELTGVRITGHDGAGKGFDKTANNLGQVGLPLEGSPGEWHFEASKDGYQSKIWDQEITDGGKTRYAFLKKIPDISSIDLYLTVHEGSIYGQILSGVRVNGHDGADKNFGQITNTNGLIVLKGSPGEWHFEASKDGYQTETWDQELISSASRDAFLVNITERPPPPPESLTLCLTVHEGNIYGKMLSGVRVTGWDGAGKHFDLITRFDGVVVLNGSPGTWHFEASKDGYQTETWDQELISSANRDAFLVKSQIQDTTLVGCHEDPHTGQVICSDDASVFLNEPIAQPLSDDTTTYADYCANQGYNYQDGRCIFPDGTSCDALEFYRGMCEYSYQANNEPFQSQPGCTRDPLTGQMICLDDFGVVSQQEQAPEPILGPIPAVSLSEGY